MQRRCEGILDQTIRYAQDAKVLLGVVACSFNPATLRAEFGNSVGSIRVGG